MYPRSLVMRGLGLTALGVLVAAGAVPAAANGPPPQEPSPTEVPTFATAVDTIVIDAVVTDDRGRTVEGLAVEDFVVREDGEPQVLTSFEAVDLSPGSVATAPPQPTPADARRSSANDREPDSLRRIFLIVMDDTGLGLDSAAAARRAARHFLSEATRPGDLVTMVVPGAGLTWSARLPEGQTHLLSIVDSVSGLRELSPDLASDWEALQAAGILDPLAQERVRGRLDAAGRLPRESRFPGESEESYNERNRILQAPFVQMVSQRQLAQDQERRRRLFESVSTAVDSMASLKGRKSVLLFSEGFVQEPDDPALRQLITTLRRHNASVYFVNVQRLTSGAAADSRQPGDRSRSTRVVDPREGAGAEVVAEHTGGFTLRNPEALEGGLARIASESSSYYLLGYSSTNPKRDGEYRHLQVELRRPDLKVRARDGYYASAPGDAASGPGGGPDGDPDLERALSGVVPAQEVPLHLTAFTLQPVDKGRARVRLAAEIGLKAVQFEEGADGSLVATLDVAMALNHVKASGRQRTPWQELRLSLPRQTEGQDLWMPVEGSFDVPGGACQAKVAVRDRGSGALGSVLHAFEVPDPEGWHVSTPILSQMPGPERGSPPRARVSRSFLPDLPLYCYLEVYRGGDRKAKPGPGVSLRYTLVDARGKTRSTQAASPPTVSSAGTPTLLEAIPLAGLEPGRYELRILVEDEIAGRTQELREPFVVKRPERSGLATYVELIRAFLAGDVARAWSGVLEWQPHDLEKLASSLPPDDLVVRRAALRLHTGLALRLWGNARGLEADAQIDIARAVLARDAPPALHRDWLLALGEHHLAAAMPAKALPFFEDCTRLFPAAVDAWLGAGMCHELAAFPDGLAFSERPARGVARSAERCYREAVRLDPTRAEAHLRLGRVLGRTGALDEAEKELAAAADLPVEGPLKALAQVFWGEVGDLKGDLAGAARHYRAALEADPDSLTAALALSEALHRLGRRREAADTLVSVLRASRATDISAWHAYHLGPGRQSPSPSPLQETMPVAVGPAPPSGPP